MDIYVQVYQRCVVFGPFCIVCVPGMCLIIFHLNNMTNQDFFLFRMKCDTMAQENTDTTPELRPMTSELSLLSRSDGSSSFSQGDTCIMAAVYGPGEVKMNKELIDRATVEVIFKPKMGLPACADKLQERLVRNSCEAVIISTLHPRTSISITVQEMQNCGSLVACCINASCLALLDAGVPMKSTVASVHCILDDTNSIILDPTTKEQKKETASLTFAFESQSKSVILSHCTGTFSNEQYHKCLTMCKHAADNIFTFYRNAIKKKLSKNL